MKSRLRPWARPVSLAVAMALILISIWMVDWRWLATALWITALLWVLSSTDLPQRQDPSAAGAHSMDHLLHRDAEREPLPLRPDSMGRWPGDEDEDEDEQEDEAPIRPEVHRGDPFAA